jgi:hypothetical protein
MHCILLFLDSVHVFLDISFWIEVSNVHDNMVLGRLVYRCEHTLEDMEEVVQVERGYLGVREDREVPTCLDHQEVLDVREVLGVQEVHHVHQVQLGHRLVLEVPEVLEVQGVLMVL